MEDATESVLQSEVGSWQVESDVLLGGPELKVRAQVVTAGQDDGQPMMGGEA